jgi:hypothetical protein
MSRIASSVWSAGIHSTSSMLAFFLFVISFQCGSLGYGGTLKTSVLFAFAVCGLAEMLADTSNRQVAAILR